MSTTTRAKLCLHPVSQPSRAVAWFVEKHKLPVDIEVINFPDLSKPEFVARNYWGAVPWLEVNGTTLSESNAILTYLAAANGIDAEYPTDPLQRAKVHEMLLKHDSLGRQVAGQLVRPFVGVFFGRFTVDQAKEAVQKNGPEAAEALTILNDLLGRHAFIVGNSMTVADYTLICELNQLHALWAAPGLLPAVCGSEHFPNVVRYLNENRAADPLERKHVATFEGFISKILAPPAAPTPAAA